MSTAIKPKTMTLKQGAKYITMSVGWLWNKVQAKEVAVIRCGRAIRFRPEDLDALIEKMRVPAEK